MMTDEQRIEEITAGRPRERLSHPCGTGHGYRCLAPLRPYGPCDCICHELLKQLEAQGKDATRSMAVLYEQMENDRTKNKEQQARITELEQQLEAQEQVQRRALTIIEFADGHPAMCCGQCSREIHTAEARVTELEQQVEAMRQRYATKKLQDEHLVLKAATTLHDAVQVMNKEQLDLNAKLAARIASLEMALQDIIDTPVHMGGPGPLYDAGIASAAGYFKNKARAALGDQEGVR